MALTNFGNNELINVLIFAIMEILVVALYVWTRNLKGIFENRVFRIQSATLGLCEYQNSNECGPAHLSNTIYCNIRRPGASNCKCLIYFSITMKRHHDQGNV